MDASSFHVLFYGPNNDKFAWMSNDVELPEIELNPDPSEGFVSYLIDGTKSLDIES